MSCAGRKFACGRHQFQLQSAHNEGIGIERHLGPNIGTRMSCRFSFHFFSFTVDNCYSCTYFIFDRDRNRDGPK